MTPDYPRRLPQTGEVLDAVAASEALLDVAARLTGGLGEHAFATGLISSANRARIRPGAAHHIAFRRGDSAGVADLAAGTYAPDATGGGVSGVVSITAGGDWIEVVAEELDVPRSGVMLVLASANFCSDRWASSTPGTYEPLGLQFALALGGVVFPEGAPAAWDEGNETFLRDPVAGTALGSLGLFRFAGSVRLIQPIPMPTGTHRVALMARQVGGETENPGRVFERQVVALAMFGARGVV